MRRTRYEGRVDVTIEVVEEWVRSLLTDGLSEKFKDAGLIGAEHNVRHGTVEFFFSGSGLLPVPEGADACCVAFPITRWSLKEKK